ncbi:MAG TPA: sigma-70 family RNA polymerase sigma factor [Gemmataceae bacterium]|nr:sigma-70 family RNA polymerase sigma factor [Gemmataceae bacterium]
MAEFNRRAAEYRRQLIEFVRRRLPRSDRDAASDFVQDALLEAQQRAELLRALTPQQTYAWLVAVLKYKMANAGRTRRRRRRLDAGRAAAAPETLDLVPTPEELAERAERMRRIERALAELTAGQRLAIVLRFYAGWTLDEIARHTGRSRASVFRRIQRGLTHLEKTGEFTIADLA